MTGYEALEAFASGSESAINSYSATEPLSFTPRQLQLVGLIAAGFSNQEIAERMRISVRTVRMHSDVVRLKLGVNNRRQIPAMYRLLTGDDPHEAGACSTLPLE